MTKSKQSYKTLAESLARDLFVEVMFGYDVRSRERVEQALHAHIARCDSLFEAIQHGDAEHRAWLKEAIENHFAGKPVPPPR